MRGVRGSGPRRLAHGVLGAGALLLVAVAPVTEGHDRVTPLAFVLAEPGRSLRAAVEALERGERALADALLRAVSERHPIIADHADLLRMRLRVETGDTEGAVAFEPSWVGRETPLRPQFYALLGRAYQSSGDEVRARAAWESAAGAISARAQLAELELAVAKSYLREGARESAGERLLDVWTRYPEQREAVEADAHLAQLESELGRPLRTGHHLRVRGDQLFSRHHNEAALAAYERALQLGLKPRERTRVAHQRAETLFRLRRYGDAIGAYGDLPATDAREIQRARAEARSGRVIEGARALETLGAKRRGAQAVNAQYLAALLWDGEGEHERARRLFEGVIQRSPSSSYATAALWWLGWEAFRAGRLDAAACYFEELAHSEPDPVSALRPRYWQIRVREEQGDAGVAALYSELAREFPLTYYGWRALERSGQPVEPLPQPDLGPGPRALRPEALARPRILLEAGLVDAAGDELARLFAAARGLEDRLALAELYADIGDFYNAQRLVVDAYSERLARGPAPEYLELWWHAWPAPYEDALQRATQSGLPSRELVYSIMREESGYRPEVISVAGARGLLQLMPDTASRVARSVSGNTVDPADLFRPEVNIELGSAYLGELLSRFDGNASAAIGSYNAGPHVVARWLRESRPPDDVWVEEIPYDETRAYVKRVLRSLHAYRVLY